MKCRELRCEDNERQIGMLRCMFNFGAKCSFVLKKKWKRDHCVRNREAKFLIRSIFICMSLSTKGLNN